MDRPIVLEHGDTQASIAVDAGGRLAQLTVGGQPLLIEPLDDPASTGWGSFPMAPWAGRIRHGRFRFLGVDHRLLTNHQDGRGDDANRRHAIHGTVFARRWDVVERDAASISMTCELTGALDWAFAGTASHRIEVVADGLRCELSVESAGDPFPAEIGWHPWFLKPERLDFTPAAMYARDSLGLPTGELIAPPAGPWDDCFVNVDPVTLHYDRPTASSVTLTSDCDHWVVYDEPDHATCVEPQSGPPDAVAVRPRLTVPGNPLRRTLRVSW